MNEILISIYGEGLEPVETTEIEIDLDAYENDENDLMFLGLVLARRPSRDAAVKLSENTYVLAGEFEDWGGSAKYPKVTWKEGTVIVAEIPASMALELPKGVNYHKKDRKTVLLEERERLVKRIAEIDALLDQ